MFPLINTPHPEGVIISQPNTSFLGMIFDVDHDFEGPRSPRAHLDTVLGSQGTKPVDWGKSCQTVAFFRKRLK